jgi:F-type H+-transporting ATPase subunit gamma
VSETLGGLRKKIAGADKLKGVVRAMKGMAAASIGQYEAAVIALAAYEAAINQGLGAAFREAQGGMSSGSDPARTPAKDPAVGAVVFGSDQGLVGQFNEVLSRYVAAKLDELPGPKVLFTVGQRIEGGLASAGLTPTQTFSMPTSVHAITRLVGDIQIASEGERAEGKYTQLFVFHNRPEEHSRYGPVCQRLLPLDSQWRHDLSKIAWPNKCIPETVGGIDVTLKGLVREYLFISLYKACAESLASENAARLAAMQRAEKNIDEMTTDLHQTFNRLRQSSIDEELFDVIAGSTLSA